MIFRRYTTIQSKKKTEELKRNLLGQHLKVHVLDFEVVTKGEDLKIIPHAEYEDHVYTLPITRLKITNSTNGSTIKMMSKPRRIDIGGPYLIVIFCGFMLLAAVLFYLFGHGEYTNMSYMLCGIAVLIFAILYVRLQMGYFDYIRKINKWVRDNV